MRPAVSTTRRRERVIHPSAWTGMPTRTGRRRSTAIRAVTPQLSSPTSAQAMTSSTIVHRMPPWMTCSQPSKRSSSVTSHHDRPGSTWRSRPNPPALSVPQAKQLCSANSKRPLGVSIPGLPARAGPDGADGAASDVKVLDLSGLGLDEVFPRPDLLAHQHREDLIGQRGVLAVDPQERARFGVHRGFPELVRVHLAEALEPLDRQVLDVEVLDDLVALLLGLGVTRDLSGADPVERRLGDVEVALVDHLRHVAVEEGQQQRPDVCAIDVGVGHDDDPVVAKLGRVEALADPRTESDDQRADVLAREDLVEARLLDVEQLAPERQDGLVAPVPALLGRAAGRVTLDEIELAPSRVTLLAVRQLARKRHPVERALSDDEVARLAGGLAGARGREALLDDPPPVGRVLIELLPEAVRHRSLDLALHLGVPELGLRLPLELRIGQLDADDRGQALADVVA